MKKVINVVLAICAVGLLYLCYASIMGPIDFELEKKKRDKAVIARLVDIKNAQIEYRNAHGAYTNNFDSLIDFIKNGSISEVRKEGELNDQQRESGLTEAKAMKIINKAKETGKWKEVEDNGLTNFKRDTIMVPVLTKLFNKNYLVDSIKYVPYIDNQVFELDAKIDTLKSGPARFFEARTPFHVYLKGLDKQEIDNMINLNKELNKYPGLKVGSMDEPITTGNWESL